MKYLSLFKESTETKFGFDKMIEHISYGILLGRLTPSHLITENSSKKS